MEDAGQKTLILTLVTTAGRQEVAVPGGVPVRSFLADLLVWAGLDTRPAANQWTLATAGHVTVEPDRSLADAGVSSGEIVYLSSRPPGPPAAPSSRPPGVPGQPDLVVADGASPRPVPSPAPEPRARAAPLAPRAQPGKPSNGRSRGRVGALPGTATVPPPVEPVSPPPLAEPVSPGAAIPLGGPAPVGAGWAGGPGPDALTPIERTRSVLPARVGVTRRLVSAGGAFFGAIDGRPVVPAVAPDLAALGSGAGRPGPALPLAGRAPAPSSDDLAVVARTPRLTQVRLRWRALDQVARLDSVITRPRLNRCATVALVSPKGGVGKTTLTALLGTLLALVRRDHVVAVDTNPDFGSLGRVLTPDQRWYVDDILDLLDQPDLTLTGLDAHLGRAVHGLLVVPAPTDPARMERLDEVAYTRIIGRLKTFSGVVLLDCGTGLQEPAARAAIKACDQVVLITDGEPATASLVAEAAVLLRASDRPVTIVVNKLPRRRARLDIERLASFIPDARGLVVIPAEPAAAAALAVGKFDWRDAPLSWKVGVRELAVALLADHTRLGISG